MGETTTMFLPCPFCGRSPRVTSRATATGESGSEIWFAACHGGGYAAHAHQFAESEASLADKWNKRIVVDDTVGEKGKP
jgi:Lar family restriction alleviation protein